MKLTIFIVCFVFTTFGIYSQNCGAYQNYIPDAYTPTICYKINIHVFNDDNGNGIYSQYSSADFDNQISLVNQIFQYLEAPTMPVNPPANMIPDTRIRFFLQSVTFHNSTTYYNSTNICGATHYNAFGVNTSNEINVFYYYNPAFSQNPSGCAPGMYVNMISFANLNWVSAQMLAHELGHSLSLSHTWSDSFDDTYYPDNNQSWLSCNYSSISNNLMGYNTCRSYLSPFQIGQMHFVSLTSKSNYINILSTGGNCSENIQINTVWNLAKLISCNTIVNSNSTLTSNCNAFLIPETDLIIDNGEFVSNNEFRSFSDALVTIAHGSWQCNGVASIKASDINIFSGGYLYLNNGAECLLSDGATIVVKNGGTLVIGESSITSIDDGCSIIVEDGGELLYNGGTIILEGNNSVIEFKGNLVIADNTTFTYSGNGYLLFSKTGYPSTNIVPGTNSKIWINGSGNTDKVLEISQETMYALGLAEFKITNAKVELHNDSRLSVDGPIVLTGAAFTSNTGSNNQHRGVTVFGQNGISINGCSFSYGKYGLYSINTYGGNGLTLNNCTFHHNETGLVTVDKYASMVECTFINNTLFGWEAIGMTQPSTATLSYFHYNFQGIKYEASSTSGLFLNGETRVDYNEFMGVEFFGNATLSLNCAKVRFNGIYYSTAPGILLHHGASVNMSPSQNPSCNRNAAQGNYYTIMTEDPANPGSSNNYLNFIHLGGGYNNLTPLAGTMAVKGKVKGYSCIPSSTSENNNMWKSTYTAPIWNVDYQTYNANCRPGTPLYLTDNGPGYLACSGGGSSSSSMAGFSIVEDITESDGDQIYISSLDYPYSSLTSATNNATYYLTAFDAVGNDSTALNRLTQIINYLLDNPYPASDESLYNLLSYCQLAIAGINNQVNQLSSSINNDPIFSLLGIYDRLIAAKNPSDSASYIAWFELSLGKAHLYHTMGLYDLALNEIDIIYPFSRKDQLSVLDRWYCLISNEKDLKNKNITPDEFALSLTLCNLGLRNMENGISYSENPTNAYSECDFHVFPNPAKTVITFTLPDNAYYLIYVYNASGNEVIKTNTNDLGFCELSVANLPTGLYFIEAVGQKVFRAKFIKD